MRTMSLLLLLLLAPRRRLSRNTRPSFLRRRRRFVFAPFFFFFFFFVCLFSIHYFSLSLFTLCKSFLCFFKTLNGTVVKKRNKNLKIFHPFIVFCISLSSVSLSDIHRLSSSTPSSKVVRLGKSSRKTVEEGLRALFLPPKVRARRRDQKHFLVGRISVISESVVFLSRRENVLL